MQRPGDICARFAHKIGGQILNGQSIRTLLAASIFLGYVGSLFSIICDQKNAVQGSTADVKAATDQRNLVRQQSGLPLIQTDVEL
jgi:hypothetical protein